MQKLASLTRGAASTTAAHWLAAIKTQNRATAQTALGNPLTPTMRYKAQTQTHSCMHDEAYLRTCGNGMRQCCLPAAWRPMQQHTPWRLNTKPPAAQTTPLCQLPCADTMGAVVRWVITQLWCHRKHSRCLHAMLCRAALCFALLLNVPLSVFEGVLDKLPYAISKHLINITLLYSTASPH